MTIPVWHDDQQGTAVVTAAGLLNALEVVGKRLDSVRIAMIGMGAANTATWRLLKAFGVDPARIVACDSRGTLHPGRGDIAARRDEFAERWNLCTQSNGDRVLGGIADALRGADVCIAFSRAGPGTIDPAWVGAMARDAIVFACANPVPEIWPWAAHEAGARVVATGRGDFPNQVNNSLCFPAIFRGVLDVRARTISDGMAIAAAREIAAFARARGIHAGDIVPRMDEHALYPRVAAAVGMAAQAEGLARVTATYDELVAGATARMAAARHATEVLMTEGAIAAPPG